MIDDSSLCFLLAASGVTIIQNGDVTIIRDVGDIHELLNKNA